MRTLCFSALLMTACDPSEGETGSPNDTADTGGVPDSGDTADTADSGDTGDLPVEPDLSFVLGGEFRWTTLTLTWIDPTSLGSETLVFGDVLATQVVTGTPQDMTAPAPDPSALYEIDPLNLPGFLVAFYVPALVSGDGLYVGAGTTWPAYVTGSIPSDLGMAGIHEGWNALDISGGEADPQFAAPLAIPLMGAAAEVTVGGTYAGETEGFGLTMLSYAALSTGASVAPLYDTEATPAWSMTVGGKPPLDHLAYIDFIGVDGALEVPVSYADVDTSGAYSEGDSLLWPACTGDVAVGLLWVPGVPDLATALGLTMSGTSTGWVPILLGAEGGVVDPASGLALTMDETCTLDN